MSEDQLLSRVKALTFDLFGTVLDLAGSLTPPIGQLLEQTDAEILAEEFWEQWRARQRIEQYQDTIVMLGHSGYLETARRALVYTLNRNQIEPTGNRVDQMMAAWNQLSPFPEVLEALERLAKRFQLVALSNGNRYFLDHLVENRIRWKFDEVISVDVMGAFKPHPSVYRRAAKILELEPGECLMVSANSFDVMGARACGFRAAFVNRLALPYEDSEYKPDVTVSDFSELADSLL